MAEFKDIGGKLYIRENLYRVTPYMSFNELWKGVNDIQKLVKKGTYRDVGTQPFKDYDSDGDVSIYGYRLADKEEIGAYERQLAEHEARKLDWDRQQYEALKKKFEGPGIQPGQLTTIVVPTGNNSVGQRRPGS